MLAWLFLCATVLPVAEAGIQDDIERVLVEERLVGVSWMLLGADGAASLGSAGVRDNATGAAFAPDTRFHVGSLTKAVLATGVLRLATEGRVDLDAPVVSYVPGLFDGTAPERFA